MTGTLRLRCNSNNSQPQIGNNTGQNPRDILDTQNGVRKAGDTMTGALTIDANLPGTQASLSILNGIVHVRNGRFIIEGTSRGYLFGSVFPLADESRLYRAGDNSLRLRCTSSNAQPQIENNSMGGARDIIDTINGDARYMRQIELEPLLARIAALEARIAELGEPE